VTPLRNRVDQPRPPRGTPSLEALLNDWAPEKLLVLGSGPVPVDGASRGALALDVSGDSVLAMTLDGVWPRAPAQIADELDRLAQMTATDLEGAQAQPPPESSVEERFTELFGAPAPRLNHDQAAILMVDEVPTGESWRRLSSELGARLRGVFRLEDGSVSPVSPPMVEAGPTKAASRLQSRSVVGMMILGAVLALAAIVRIVNPPAAITEISAAPRVETVARGVPGSATHTQWIGQQHIVHTSDGRLLALFAVPGGLDIVSDRADNGATWGSPFTINSISPQSFSVAGDATGRLHVAFSDADGVAYSVMTPAQGGWRASPPVRLDAHTKTPLVDVAWDGSHGIAHVVWSKDTAGGQEPFWAAVRSTKTGFAVVGSRAVTPAGRAVPVLVNEVIDPESGSLLVTYRGGTSIEGWWSRTVTPSDSGDWRWAQPERIPTHAFIGAAALAADRHGVAHLVLRDSTDYRLLYFIHRESSGWSQGEVAVQAHATSQVDFPALALDGSSQLVYLFFETDQFETSPEIRVAVRDPSNGWQEPVSVAAPPEGDLFPTALRNASGQAIALWTRGSAVASIQAARFAAR
jgi:hypothetical protein